MTGCAFTVIQGVEHEERFDAGLRLLGESDTGDTTAISIHVSGPDVTAASACPASRT